MKSKESLLERFVQKDQEIVKGDPKAIQKQHERNRLTARERISLLLDPGTFVEVFRLSESQCNEFGMDEAKRPTDGVICGYGTIEGRRVFVFAQDRTVLNASVGSVHGEKIAHTIESANKAGVPCIGLFDSVGARIQESLDSTRSVGKILFNLGRASGNVPLIAAIMGTCAGVAAYSPALSDLVLMVKGTHLFITGPQVVKATLGEDVTLEELGGADVHSQKTGMADLIYKDDAGCLEGIKRLLQYLPSNGQAISPITDSGDDPERETNELLDILPEDKMAPYDIREMIKIIVDRGDFLELKPDFARNMVIGLGRLDGRTVGFVANQNLYLSGSIDIDASDKAARFVRFCDSFNIPIITMVDTMGVAVGRDQENRGILRHGAKMMYAYANSEVPKITLMLRKGYGGAKQAMCTRDLGADQVLGWPFLELVVLEAKGAVKVLYRKEIENAPDPEAMREEKMKEYEERFVGSFDAASKSFLHRAIKPKETRRALIQALRIYRPEDRLKNKAHHGNMPL
ncbi:MAG: acyl-CoA carboxylase subunit beta [Desulfobacteraceae bacterium]|nr:acyl-CoA carboxylase subunit beta [Desulfobacteraceae bacterium]